MKEVGTTVLGIGWVKQDAEIGAKLVRNDAKNSYYCAVCTY